MSHRYLVLGLLSESPMTGYEIKKRVCETMSMIASPSYGAVYPTLHRLLKEGAVTMEVVEQEGRPAKKVYSITKQGRADFEAWLQEPAAPDLVKREFLLKVLLAKRLQPGELQEHLTRRREALEAQCDALALIDSRPGVQVNGYHTWVIDYAVTLCRAELDWLDRMEEALLAGAAVNAYVAGESDEPAAQRASSGQVVG